jgi:hypothetical protein
MERIIRKLLVAWLLLLGALLLTQVPPLPGGARLGYGLVWVVMLTSPVVALLILWLLGLKMCETLHRLRVLWRARHWRRKRAANDRWMDTPLQLKEDGEDLEKISHLRLNILY